MYIVFFPQCQKVQNNSMQRAETSVVPNIFNVVLFPVHAILLPFFTICSTYIRYQKTVILYMYFRQLKQNIICVSLFYRKCK